MKLNSINTLPIDFYCILYIVNCHIRVIFENFDEDGGSFIN